MLLEPDPAAPPTHFAAARRTGERAEIDADRLLGLQSGLLSQAGFVAGTTAFAIELAGLVPCDRIAVGMVRRGRVQVVALSHSLSIRPAADALMAIGAAMDEALEQDASVRYPEPAGARPRVTAAHAALAKQDGGAALSVPLAHLGEAFGALAFVRDRADPFSDQDIRRCEQVARAIGPLLRLKHSDERPWTGRMLESLRGFLQRATGRGNLSLKAGLVLGLAAIAAATLVPVEYRIGAPARVEGEVQRALVAPVDGFLRELNARPGDRVQAGQVLAEMAQDDIRLEQRKWESELAQHENSAASALSRADRGQFVVSQARADEARAQLELANAQLVRARLLAPFDGVVIAGDLSQSLGAPVQRGETLLMVAPAERFRLLVEVDERDIAELRVGQPGTLVLGALIGRSMPFTVSRITPMASARDGRNFFDVEGRLDGAPDGLRPGLQGIARIEAGRRTVAWIWTHRLLDWARLAAWSWGL